MNRVLLFVIMFSFLVLPIKVDATAYMGDSFCITTYDGFKNLKDEFVFARTGEAGSYKYYINIIKNHRAIYI